MIALAKYPFDDSDIPDPAALLLRPVEAAPTAREAPAQPAAPMPASLWRHTHQENLAEDREARAARGFLGVLAVISLGSVGYGAWQLGALMAGNHLAKAVAAIAR